MTLLLRKQVIAGTLQISSVAGSLKVPCQGVAGVLSQSIPATVSAALRLPMQLISGGLENPPSVSGTVTVPGWAVSGTFHYVYVARRRTAATWWLTESMVQSHCAAADIGRFAKRWQTSPWWLSQPVVTAHGMIHDVGLWARGTIQSSYALRIGRNQTALWRLPVAGSHRAVYGCRAERVFSAGYALRWPITKQHAAGFAVQATDPVRRTFGSDYGIRVGAAHATDWGMPLHLKRAWAVRYAGLVPTARSHAGHFVLQRGNALSAGHETSWTLRFGAVHAARYESAVRLAARGVARHDLRPAVMAGLCAPWVLTGVTRRAQNSAYALAQYNRAAATLRSPFSGGDLTPLIGQAMVPFLRLGHRRIDLITTSIGVDEPSPWWMARLEIAHLADFGSLTVGAEVTLAWGDICFALLIDGKHRVRNSPTGLRLEVTARSPLAALAPPLGPSITHRFADAIPAEAAVRELLPGIALEWSLQEWWIPAGRLAAVQANPVEVARNIVRAAGGVLDSLPDGRVVARPLYPVSIPDYPRATVSLVLTDDDLFEAEETLEVRTDINRLRIADGDTTVTTDRVEFIPDHNDNRQGIVRVAASPWRVLSLAHTGDAFVAILPLGERLQEEMERVEFKAGVATLAWPVEALRAVRWQHRDLGSVSFTRGGIEMRAGGADGYSLAEIRYVVRVLEWQVSNVCDEAIQFLVMEA